MNALTWDNKVGWIGHIDQPNLVPITTILYSKDNLDQIRLRVRLIVFLFKIFLMEVFLEESPIKCFSRKHSE